MTSKGERDRDESSVPPEHVTARGLEDSMSPLTLGGDNLELDTEALTRLVREVLEGVFEARIGGISETLQTRCVDCGKKRDRSSMGLKSRSVKRVKTLRITALHSTAHMLALLRDISDLAVMLHVCTAVFHMALYSFLIVPIP
ncbi:hypothetical protein PVK06_038951 [Gossypium arboreum]|uniref:Uncharacterized protein n=1 Tax=Gossypium arboreum TaxID=29729 RepID=A0ABR0N220_GOSAR|nr:hypothetical protein PVK06_038951 [Gossypium arboreum]